MATKKPLKTAYIFLVAIALVFSGLILFDIYFNPNYGRHYTKERIVCGNKLKVIGLKIHLYIEENGDLPRNNAGDFSLSPIECGAQADEYCLDDKHKTCTIAKENGSGFVLNPKAKLGKSNPLYNPNSVAILCHDINHLHGKYRDFAIILFSDGTVRYICISSNEDLELYKNWVEEFQKGDSKILTYRQLLTHFGNETSWLDELEKEYDRIEKEYE